MFRTYLTSCLLCLRRDQNTNLIFKIYSETQLRSLKRRQPPGLSMFFKFNQFLDNVKPTMRGLKSQSLSLNTPVFNVVNIQMLIKAIKGFPRIMSSTISMEGLKGHLSAISPQKIRSNGTGRCTKTPDLSIVLIICRRLVDLKIRRPLFSYVIISLLLSHHDVFRPFYRLMVQQIFITSTHICDVLVNISGSTRCFN